MELVKKLGRFGFRAACLAWFFWVAGLAPVPAQADPGLEVSAGGPGSLWIIPIRGDIEPSMAAFVRREVRKALAEKAAFIVFEIDTFGGRVDSALQITSFITSIKQAQTVAWVRNSGESMGVSWSAGALIALSCSRIYMARGTSIGAAAPVTVGADGAADAAGEKTVAAVRSQMAALAERNGHPLGIALAMVDLDVELWEVRVNGEVKALTLAEVERLEQEYSGGEEPSLMVERVSVISPQGKLLSLTAGEANRFGLARGFADDRDSLVAVLGVGEGIIESAPSAADGLLSFLTSAPVQAVLIILGIVMLFLEIQTPGFGIPGVTAIIVFITVFGSGALLGRVESLEIILFLLGIGLLSVEIFILPGFGIAGISGLVLIGISLVFSMQDFVIPRFDWEWDLLGRNAVVVSVGLLAAITGIAVIALLGPRIKIFDRLTLKARITGTAGGPLRSEDVPSGEEAEGLEDYRSLAGKTGIAATTLRPSGKVEIEGRLYMAEGDGVFIEQGSPVEVIRIQGNRIVVRDIAS
ncbi:MAG: nodulation protein NfeD [Spirochaetaceae bacterium]|jgi:membrane-bound serine protease (ClpP class)|nr:nodulation protein NfeD [Spirochaetaceae bacterium]